MSDSVKPIDGSPSGSAVPGILQARTLQWVAISFSKPQGDLPLKSSTDDGGHLAPHVCMCVACERIWHVFMHVWHVCMYVACVHVCGMCACMCGM